MVRTKQQLILQARRTMAETTASPPASPWHTSSSSSSSSPCSTPPTQGESAWEEEPGLNRFCVRCNQYVKEMVRFCYCDDCKTRICVPGCVGGCDAARGCLSTYCAECAAEGLSEEERNPRYCEECEANHGSLAPLPEQPCCYACGQRGTLNIARCRGAQALGLSCFRFVCHCCWQANAPHDGFCTACHQRLLAEPELSTRKRKAREEVECENESLRRRLGRARTTAEALRREVNVWRSAMREHLGLKRRHREETQAPTAKTQEKKEEEDEQPEEGEICA